MNNAVGNRNNIIVYNRGYSTAGAVQLPLSPTSQQVMLHSYALYNANTAASDVGLGISMSSAESFFYTVAAGVATQQSVQSSSTVSLFTTSANSGILLEGRVPFGYIIMNLSQAQTGSPVYAYQYWNGTAWATLTTTLNTSYSSTGFVYITFKAPADWVPGDGGLTANNFYSVRVLATTAPSQAVQGSGVVVAKWISYQEQLSGGARLQATFSTRPILLEGSESLAPFFQTAFVQNAVEASYQAAQ